MSETETLTCKVGDHPFTRERKRGKKPTMCPEHLAEFKREALAARQVEMQERREERQREREEENVKRVIAFKAWTRRDAALWLEYKQGYISRQEWLDSKEHMPAMPDQDEHWDIARARGVA